MSRLVSITEGADFSEWLTWFSSVRNATPGTVFQETRPATWEPEHSFPIDQLPVELFDSIILMALTDGRPSNDVYGYYRQLFAIQLVCSGWSKAAISNAPVWTNLSSYMPPEVVEMILSRSGIQPLAIICQTVVEAECWGDKERWFIDRVKPLSSRWKVFDMESRSDEDFVTCLHDLALPNLVELRIHGGLAEAPRMIRIENSLPQISVLKVTGVCPQFSERIPVHSATVRSIGRDDNVVPPLEHLFQAISSVRYLRLEYITAEFAFKEMSRISLPNLITLVMVEAMEDTLSTFLNSLDTPNLQNFEVNTLQNGSVLWSAGVFAGRCLARAPLPAKSPNILYVDTSRSSLGVEYGQHCVNIYHSCDDWSCRMELFSSLFEQFSGRPCSEATRIQLRPIQESKPSHLLEIISRHCPSVTELEFSLARKEPSAIELSAEAVRASFHDVAGYLAKPDATRTWPFRHMESLEITLVPEERRIHQAVTTTDDGYLNFVNHMHRGVEPVDICFLNELVGIVRSRNMSEPDVTSIRGIKAAFGRMSREAKRELESLVPDIELYAVTVTGADSNEPRIGMAY